MIRWQAFLQIRPSVRCEIAERSGAIELHAMLKWQYVITFQVDEST